MNVNTEQDNLNPIPQRPSTTVLAVTLGQQAADIMPG